MMRRTLLTSALDMPEIMSYIYSKSWKLQFSASSSIIIIEDYYLQTFLHSLYVGATFIYFLLDSHSFLFTEFINRLIHFNMTAPFYYVLLYFQVILLAPFLYGVAVLGKRRKYIHLINLGLLFLFSVFANNMTNIMDIYGGGGVLAGGSYLILFYLGMLLKMYAEQLRKLSSLIGCVLSGFLLVLWYRFEFADRFALDQKLRLGNGINPPGITGDCPDYLLFNRFV